ncbi:MAG: sulfatase [Verrucomicrobiota bacterium]
MKPTLTLLAALLLAPLAALHAAEPPAKKPNVVLFLVDDMGWMDCGAYGSRYYQTPHIDAFAKQAMRFTDAYAMPLCSPTRASILSGQYTSRHGITSAVGHKKPVKAALPEQSPANATLLMPESGSYLDPAQYTLAEALRDAGYRTAHIGKWHLGLSEPHWPEAHGFDVTFHCHPDPGPPGGYFSPYDVLPPGSARPKDRSSKYVVGNITDGPVGEYIVDRQAAEAEKFIEASKDRPFFLNLWCYGVHGPWGHKEAYTAEFAKTTDPRGVQGNPIMASMLRSVDECLGRILAKLDALGLAENTIVIFTSDNGGNVHSNSGEDAKAQKRKGDDPMMRDWRKWAGDKPPTSNTPLRDGKGRLYEGGVRVPLMVRWPGRIAPASTSDAIVGCQDFYPTILDMAGLPTPPQQKIDGVSFAPVLRGTGTLSRDAYFIWFPHLVPGVSVRQGDWKLIRRFTERPGDYEGVPELFNLKDDLGETKNLAAQMPDKVKALDALIHAFVRDTGALYPKPNPAYKPLAAKPQPAGTKPGADPAAGLVPKFCKLTVVDGAARVEADGRTPFLGTAQIKANGPITLKLRARSSKGGPGKVQWVTQDQTEFPATGQTVAFTLPAGGEWQDVIVDIPLTGDLRLLRLYLPANKSPVEITSIQYTGKNVEPKTWNFASVKK